MIANGPEPVAYLSAALQSPFRVRVAMSESVRKLASYTCVCGAQHKDYCQATSNRREIRCAAPYAPRNFRLVLTLSTWQVGWGIPP